MDSTSTPVPPPLRYPTSLFLSSNFLFPQGWDILFEQPSYIQGWVRLARRKWFGDQSGDCEISAADFDALLGHAVAVVDVPAYGFASELIQAYPEAKVILNMRRDLDAWHRSAVKNLVDSTYNNRLLWVMCFFNRELFWMWHVLLRFVMVGAFRCPEWKLSTGINRNGKWVYRGRSSRFPAKTS